MRPDYAGGSLVNLVASIVASRGGKPLHEPLRNFAPGATNLVLLIIDGLGDNYLMRHGASSELARRRRRSLTSVFPSTTASAITTSYTGRTPLEHGLTGWFTYFGEAGCVGAPLPFRSRGDMTSLSARGVTAEHLFTVPSLFGALPVRSIVVTYRDIRPWFRRRPAGRIARAAGGAFSRAEIPALRRASRRLLPCACAAGLRQARAGLARGQGGRDAEPATGRGRLVWARRGAPAFR